MGTRSTITIKDGKRKLVTLYKQYDGYIEGLGQEIFTILNHGNAELVNGFNDAMKNPEQFNGMGCLGAYLISELKESIGGFYLSYGNDKEEYNYTIYDKKDLIYIKVTDWENRTLYNGTLKEFRRVLPNDLKAV